MKKVLALLIAGLLGAAGLAYAQVRVLPYITTLNADDAVQVIPHGQPTAGNVYAKVGQLLSAVQNYVKLTTLSFTAQPIATCGTYCPGYSNYMGNAQAALLFEPGGTLAYTYVMLAQTPSDGLQQCFFSTNTVTQFNLSPYTGGGATLANAITAMTANVRYCYMYSASNTTWDRSM